MKNADETTMSHVKAKSLITLSATILLALGTWANAIWPSWVVGSWSGRLKDDEGWERADDGTMVTNVVGVSVFYGDFTLAITQASSQATFSVIFDDGEKCKYTLMDAEVEVVNDDQAIAKFWHWNDGHDEKFYVTCTFNKSGKSIFLDEQDGARIDGEMTFQPDATIPEEWQKTRTLKGIATRALSSPHDIQGIFELKCGKVNKRTGGAKVTASLTDMDGKKKSYKAQQVKVTGRTVTVDFDGLKVSIDGDTFTGGEDIPGGLSVSSAEVGGNWAGREATVMVDVDDLSMFDGTVISRLLPYEEIAEVSGGKWKFAKAASVKWAKLKKGTVAPEIFDEDSGKGLVVDETKGKTNLSGMKLTYTPKKGTFKGSFKVYVLEGTGKATKLKKYTVKVSGVVVDGVGYGIATCKKPAISWSVLVK